MTSFVNLPSYIQSIIGMCSVIMLWASAAIIVSDVRYKNWKSFICIIPISIVLYIATQCVFYNIHKELETRGVTKIFIETYGKLPWIVILFAILAIVILETEMIRHNLKWVKRHVTATSIKEAIDDLPVGICCYESNGQIILKNHRIERICRAYTGKSLLNAVTFYNEITAGSKHTERGSFIQLENGEVFTFSDRAMNDKDSNLRMLSLVDITEQYKNTETLEEKRHLVAKLNEELILYGKQIVDSITAREILDAKVKIHDELGVNLLASKHYILSGGTEEERKNIETALYRNLQYLKQEKENIVTDEYTVILETANKLDIKLNLVGTLTEKEPQRHIIVTGIHECLTNTIRHAMGDELKVILEETETEFKAKFTNNGKAPKSEITERGGLLLLRTLVEQHDGTMEIDSAPQFMLRLVLKK